MYSKQDTWDSTWTLSMVSEILHLVAEAVNEGRLTVGSLSAYSADCRIYITDLFSQSHETF